MSDFFNKRSSKSLSKKYKEKKYINDPVIFKNSDNPEITFVIDILLSELILDKVKKQLINKVDPTIGYQILYVHKYEPLPSDLKSNLGDYYYNNRIDFKQYIPEFSKIITFGRTLFQFTEGNSDILPEAFYDFVFNKTYFFSPYVNSWVFPINYIFDIIDKDNFESFFALRQIQECLKFENNKIRIPKLELIFVDNPNKFLLTNMESKEVAWDIETNSLDWTDGKIGCITMSFDGKTGYFLEWDKIDKEILSRFFENKYQILANGKFDCLYLRQNKVKNMKVDWDTLQSGHILNMDRSNSLKSHAYYFTFFGGYEKSLDLYKKKYPKLKNYLEIPIDIMFKYAIMDSIITFQVYKQQKRIIGNNDKIYFKDKLWTTTRLLKEVVFPTINSFIEVEFEGCYINWDDVGNLSEYLEEEIIKEKKKIFEAFELDSSNIKSCIRRNMFTNQQTTKDPVDLESTEQLGMLLKSNKWKKLELSKKGIYKTNKKCLEEWAKLGYEEAKLILKYRELSTLQKTFVGYEKSNSGFFQYKKNDNKVHTNFLVMLAASLRNRGKSPNLTNIPKHGDIAKYIRKFFTIPNNDFILNEADGKSLQLMICGSLAKDKKMREVFNSPGSDMHSMTAQSIFRPDLTFEEFKKRRKTEKELDDYRFKSKAVNFSIIFNTTAKSFATKILVPEWSIEDTDNYLRKNNLVQKPYDLYSRFSKDQKDLTLKFCKYWAVAIDIKKKFFDTYPQVREWIDSSIDFAQNNGYIASPFGNYRLLTKLLYIGKDSDYRKIKKLQNITCNSPVQTVEAFLMMTTLNAGIKCIKDNNLKSKIVNNVHDSLVSYIHKDEKDIIKKVLKETFEEDIPEKWGIKYELEGENYYPLDKENPTFWGFDGEDW